MFPLEVSGVNEGAIRWAADDRITTLASGAEDVSCKIWRGTIYTPSQVDRKLKRYTNEKPHKISVNQKVAMT